MTYFSLNHDVRVFIFALALKLYVVVLLKESGVLLLDGNEYRHDSLPHHRHLHPGTFVA